MVALVLFSFSELMKLIIRANGPQVGHRVKYSCDQMINYWHSLTTIVARVCDFLLSLSMLYALYHKQNKPTHRFAPCRLYLVYSQRCAPLRRAGARHAQ